MVQKMATGLDFFQVLQFYNTLKKVLSETFNFLKKIPHLIQWNMVMEKMRILNTKSDSKDSELKVSMQVMSSFRSQLRN
jgi:hypothetical protein